MSYKLVHLLIENHRVLNDSSRFSGSKFEVIFQDWR